MLRKSVVVMVLLAAAVAWAGEPPADRAWWQKPGLGVQYQIEQRPGWAWGRNFVRFNRAMSDEQGRLKFDGPFANVAQFVALSRKVGVDYHMFEIKWHDGICYFDTRLTDWKTPVDYAGEFAAQSRAAGIPFLYYYSTIFDHNPQFDAIQPNRRGTVSLIGTVPGKVYTDYLAGQFHEIMEQYHPDGLWFDWYTLDKSAWSTIKYLRERYPQTVISFNASNLFPGSSHQLTYTSSEAHGLNLTRISFKSPTEFVTSLNSNGWRLANRNRRRFDQPWEMISPAGQNWQITALRPDLKILVRIGAMVMANGGKSLVGCGTVLSGEVIPDHVRQMEYVGQWYLPRKMLFTQATALRYPGERPPGVWGYSTSDFGAVTAKLGQDTLLHLINFTGATGPVTLTFKGERWRSADRAVLEPAGQELPVINHQITLSPDQVDQIDTIIRFK